MNHDNTHRYERKFVVSAVSTVDVEFILKCHPALFSEIYQERWVRNIYYDTPDYDFYHSNINGDTNRVKARIRWYGEQFGAVEAPMLEFKIKKGLLGWKKHYKLIPFILDSRFDHQKYTNELRSSEKNDLLNQIGFTSLFPVLVNGYRRKYFLSADHKYRITIDSEQVFYSISTNNNFFIRESRNSSNVITELKYDSSYDASAPDLSSLFPFRLGKNSKYVEGIQSCYCD